MAKAKPRFYVLHGENDFERDTAIDKMRAEMQAVDSAGLNLSEVDGTQTSTAELIGMVSVSPFLADRRLVIVRGFITWITRKGAGKTGKAQLDRLLDELPTLPEWARLVFIEPKALNANNSVLKLATDHEHGYVKLFDAEKNLVKWVTKQAERYESRIDFAAAQAIAEVVNGDMRRADNELIKLVSYADGQPITEDMVALLTPYTKEANIWRMIDAMAYGRGEEALNMLYTVLSDKNTSAFQVWSALIGQFRQMLLAKEHLSTGGSVKTLPDAIGKKFVPRELTSQIKRFSLRDLEAIYRRLLDYDTKIKTGGIKVELALDIVFTTIARNT